MKEMDRKPGLEHTAIDLVVLFLRSSLGGHRGSVTNESRGHVSIGSVVAFLSSGSVPVGIRAAAWRVTPLTSIVRCSLCGYGNDSLLPSECSHS
jgi:hypothetical protein